MKRLESTIGNVFQKDVMKLENVMILPILQFIVLRDREVCTRGSLSSAKCSETA
jgi:hypothetical protein